MAVAWKKLAYEDDVITKAFMATKGDILYASANAVPAVLPKAQPRIVTYSHFRLAETTG